jgi:hypothetical protein
MMIEQLRYLAFCIVITTKKLKKFGNMKYINLSWPQNAHDSFEDLFPFDVFASVSHPEASITYSASLPYSV